MKRFFISVALLIASNTFAQTIGPMQRIRPNYFSLQATQDVKLATFKDDGHGNSAWTTDVHTKLHFNAWPKDNGNYAFAGAKIEYADLAGGSLFRWGFEGGYSFAVLYTRDGFNDRSLVRIKPLAGFGWLHRSSGGGMFSLEFGADITFDVLHWLSFVTSHYLTQRPEWGTMPYNFGAGLEVRF